MTPPPGEFAKRAYLDVALPTSWKTPIEELPPGLVEELAPDVHLAVAPLLRRNGRWQVGEVGEELSAAEGPAGTPEHCVVMRRLRSGADAQSLLEKGMLSSRLIPRCRRWLDRRREVLEERRVTGRALDGHGDLQLAHVWFDGPAFEPSIIDCTEFNEDFRRIDAASEVAFLAMDIRYRGQHELAEQFLARYAHRADDFSLYALVDDFAGCRAAIRAKVALKHLAKRERSGRDASDAGPALYRWSVENFQPPTEWPRETLIAIATDDPKWRAGLPRGIH